MSTVIADQWTSASGVAHINGTRPRFAVTFTGNGNPITKVSFKLKLYTAGTAANVQAEIYSVASNLPATLLATSTPILSSMIPSGTLTWMEFVFDGTFTPVNGTKYYAAIARPTGNPIIELNTGSASGYTLARMEVSNWVLHDDVTNFIVYTSGSGGGGCSCDWNNVPFIHLKGNMVLDAATSPPDPNQVIEIYNTPYEFKAFDSGQEGSIVAYLRSTLWAQIGHDWNDPKSAALKFTSLAYTTLPNPPQDDPNQKFSVYLSLVNFGATSPNAGIACSRHFVVRKDLVLNGMLNCVEGAIVLHAGKYRRWGGTLIDQPTTRPTIFSGGDFPWQSGFNVVEFRRFDTRDFIPIRCKGLLDSNDNLGANGQVLTNTNSGLLWQNAVNVTSRIEKGQVQTNNNGDDIIVNFSPTFTNQPI
ncbi:MAG: hypothetical protein FWD52_09835, partial [Candidatus Bathyarchaeota archaeon]|nr:hypothetical protein [Candidatus Termiticorpusculum sp.]